MLFSKTNVSKNSTFLVRLAWSVEIIAVLIGLTISMVVAISAFNSFGDSKDGGLLAGLPAILVAALPFLLIAVVEVCKIPLTYTFMNVKHPLWRILFLCFVTFLCLITFETMLNGFERNFSNLNRAIDDKKNSIENVESEIQLLEKRRSYIVKFDEQELTGEIETQQSQVDSEYKLSAERAERRLQRTLKGLDYSFQEKLETQLDRLLQTRDTYYEQWAAESAAVEERFSTLLLDNISGSSDERTRLLSELTLLKTEFNTARSNANFFTRSSVESKYRALIKDKEAQIAAVTSGYLGGEAIAKQAAMEAQLRDQLAFVNSKYEGRVSDLNARIEDTKLLLNERQAEVDQQVQSAVRNAANEKRYFAQTRDQQVAAIDEYEATKMAELLIFTEKAFTIDEQIFALRNQQRTLQSQINHLINQNQIYRLAMYAYGMESATDVKRDMVGVVALIWFGSLSLIGSVCGVMLALAGFYLRRCAEHVEAQDAAAMNKTIDPAAANADAVDLMNDDLGKYDNRRAPPRQRDRQHDRSVNTGGDYAGAYAGG